MSSSSSDADEPATDGLPMVFSSTTVHTTEEPSSPCGHEPSVFVFRGGSGTPHMEMQIAVLFKCMKSFSFSGPCIVLLRGPIVLSEESCEFTVILYPSELGPERLELRIVRFQRGRHYVFKQS